VFWSISSSALLNANRPKPGALVAHRIRGLFGAETLVKLSEDTLSAARRLIKSCLLATSQPLISRKTVFL